MMPARQLVIALAIVGTSCGARAADGGSSGLELCIQTARDSDTTCAKLTDPAGRLQCFQTARTAQLDCLEHVLLPDAPTGATASSKQPETPPAAQPAPVAPLGTPPQAAPAQGVAQDDVKKDVQANTKDGPAGNGEANPPKPTVAVASPKEPATAVQATPAPVPPPAAQSTTSAVQADAPKIDAPKTEAPDSEAVKTEAPKSEPPKSEPSKSEAAKSEAAKSEPPKSELPKSEVAKTEAPKIDAPRIEASKIETPKIETPKIEASKIETPKIDASKKAGAAATPPPSGWVVSETTSPVDYRPLLAAVILPASRSPDGPSRLAVRCLGGQTELSVRTEGVWHAPRKNALPVDHQVNDQSMIRQIWNLSADAKTATYAGDAVELLRSLPDAARLTVNVPDGGNARHDATFLLTGWDAVRRKIEAACKWPKATDQASSTKR